MCFAASVCLCLYLACVVDMSKFLVRFREARHSMSGTRAINELLRSCGATLAAGESPLDGLRRHAQEHRWRRPTLRRWENALRQHLHVIAESAFDSLTQLNAWLVRFDLPAETSKSRARTALRSVFINIYDLLQGRHDERHASLSALRKYSHEKRLFYPLRKAKNEGLRDFLRPIR